MAFQNGKTDTANPKSEKRCVRVRSLDCGVMLSDGSPMDQRTPEMELSARSRGDYQLLTTPVDATFGRRRVALVLIAVLYVVAGLFHLASPQVFLSVMPPWVPYPDAVILVTGLIELAGIIALLVPRTRRLGAIVLSVYAICVYPANIWHAVQDLSKLHPGSLWLYHAPRLFAQPFIVWWSLYAGGVVGGLRTPTEAKMLH